METVKEKLIEMLKGIGSNCICNRESDECEICEYNREDVVYSECCEYKVAEYLIQNGVTSQEWVSVDERMPEESGDYLVIAKSGSIFRYYYSHEEREFGEYVEIELDFVEKPDTVWISLDTITHWMPIPDLPKGVK